MNSDNRSNGSSVQNRSNDPLLANLNAFKSKVKSAPVISNNANVSPSKKRLASQVKQEEKEDERIIIDGEGDDDLKIIEKKDQRTPEIEIISDGEESTNDNSNKKLKSSGISSKSNDDDVGKDFKKDETVIKTIEDEYDDSPSKKVRPGSLAAAALQASQNNVSKTHDSSKLLWATEYIQKKGKPVPMNELMDYLSLSPNDKVIDLLKKLEKIQYDTKKNSFKYMSTYDVHSGSELIKLLKAQVTFKGVSCKELKDGWPQCDETINELEEDSKILVLRTKKDRTPRYVWYNNGGDLHRIDEQFITMWENVQLPQFSELPRKLQDLGLKPASVDPASIKRQTKVEVKKKKQRRGKITNTHMAGILKDYSHRV